MRRQFFILAGTQLCLAATAQLSSGAEGAAPTESGSPVPALVEQFCADCHDAETKKGSLNLEAVETEADAGHQDVWEKVVRRLRARQMPPAAKSRPEEKEYERVLRSLERSLDAAALEKPNPGRTESIRRLNRTEYQNAIRDLLGLEIDAEALLPKEDAGHGFDNVTVGTLSPALLDRYITAAEKISQLAVGATHGVAEDVIRLRGDLTQEEHVEGLPLGTRGGTLIPYTFPQDAEYEVQLRLTRDRNEEIEGLREAHEVQLLLDGKLVQSFTVKPPEGHKNFELVDQHLKARMPVTAGLHQVGVTFVKNPSSLLETKRQPYAAHFNLHRHPRLTPAIYQVSINGPYEARGPGDTASRRKIFVSYPTAPGEDEGCATQILTTLLRRAYRRPVTKEDLEKPLAFYHAAQKESGFEAGIQAALSAVLVNPNFLFRVEQDPENVAPGTAYRISDVELASRLSFFLWSSIPDDELLAVAERGELSKPGMLEKQTMRMLKDERAKSLVTNFAGQWLYLRNLEAFTPDLRQFPDFDDNLREAFREETEQFFGSILREDRSVLDLVRSNETFVNERLAVHYGIPHVYGSRFRRVVTEGENRRGGLLRQGSILTVTSYANRTSPVLRGHWILANLIGTPPPPPPENVPALKDNTVSATLSGRERLAEHRAHAECASCHDVMDPVGFALENFDAVGRWRTLEEGKPVNAEGGLPDGSKFTGVEGLEEGLLKHPEVFVGTLAEKLLTFALGRGIENYDAPAIRKAVREAAGSDYRFSTLIVGLTKSIPFTMRRSL